MIQTYLLKKENNKTRLISINQDVEPRKLGVCLSKYFSTEQQAKMLFSSQERIDFIENNKIHYLSREQLRNLFLQGMINLFDTDHTSYTSIPQFIETLATNYSNIKYLYIYQHNKWICYTGYQVGKKRIVEEIHLDNLCYSI